MQLSTSPWGPWWPLEHETLRSSRTWTSCAQPQALWNTASDRTRRAEPHKAKDYDLVLQMATAPRGATASCTETYMESFLGFQPLPLHKSRVDCGNALICRIPSGPRLPSQPTHFDLCPSENIYLPLRCPHLKVVKADADLNWTRRFMDWCLHNMCSFSYEIVQFAWQSVLLSSGLGERETIMIWWIQRQPDTSHSLLCSIEPGAVCIPGTA